MNTHTITSIARTAIVAAGIGAAAAIAAAGPAAATANDQFVGYVESIGITIDSPQAVLTVANNVCAALGDGQSAVSIGRNILSQNKITTEQAAEFVVASVKTFCPQYGNALQA